MFKKALLLTCSILIFAGCTESSPTIYDDLAACITDSGAKMYGTDWCPHCKDQKEAFGTGFKNIEYINCEIDKSTCTENGITGYPTWILGDGERLSGNQDLSVLADKTECELPTNE